MEKSGVVAAELLRSSPEKSGYIEEGLATDAVFCWSAMGTSAITLSVNATRFITGVEKRACEVERDYEESSGLENVSKLD